MSRRRRWNYSVRDGDALQLILFVRVGVAVGGCGKNLGGVGTTRQFDCIVQWSIITRTSEFDTEIKLKSNAQRSWVSGKESFKIRYLRVFWTSVWSSVSTLPILGSAPTHYNRRYDTTPKDYHGQKLTCDQLILLPHVTKKYRPWSKGKETKI